MAKYTSVEIFDDSMDYPILLQGHFWKGYPAVVSGPPDSWEDETAPEFSIDEAWIVAGSVKYPLLTHRISLDTLDDWERRAAEKLQYEYYYDPRFDDAESHAECFSDAECFSE